MRWSFVLACFVGLISCHATSLLAKPPESLVISNENDQPIKVFIRPTGADSPDTRWSEPMVVDAHSENSMTLPPYEPFDIDIRLDDETDIVSEEPVYLCWMTDNCKPGKQDWYIDAKGWHRDRKGVPHLDPAFDRRLDIHADLHSIRIPVIKLVSKKLPDPVPEPAPPPPKIPKGH